MLAVADLRFRPEKVADGRPRWRIVLWFQDMAQDVNELPHSPRSERGDRKNPRPVPEERPLYILRLDFVSETEGDDAPDRRPCDQVELDAIGLPSFFF